MLLILSTHSLCRTVCARVCACVCVCFVHWNTIVVHFGIVHTSMCAYVWYVYACVSMREEEEKWFWAQLYNVLIREYGFMSTHMSMYSCVCVPMPINKLRCKEKYRSIASTVKTVSRFSTYVYPRMCVHTRNPISVWRQWTDCAAFFTREFERSCALPLSFCRWRTASISPVMSCWKLMLSMKKHNKFNTAAKCYTLDGSLFWNDEFFVQLIHIVCVWGKCPEFSKSVLIGLVILFRSIFFRKFFYKKKSAWCIWLCYQVFG